MSVKAVQVNVVTSVDNFLALVEAVVTDVKAGKSPAVVVAEAVPELVTALSSLGDLSSDVTNTKAVATTVGIRLANLVAILA